WAEHYSDAPDLGMVLDFIWASQASERSRKLRKWGLWIFAPLAVLFAGLAVAALYQGYQARLASSKAQKRGTGRRQKRRKPISSGTTLFARKAMPINND